jgi:hypothetical protein
MKSVAFQKLLEAASSIGGKTQKSDRYRYSSTRVPVRTTVRVPVRAGTTHDDLCEETYVIMTSFLL